MDTPIFGQKLKKALPKSTLIAVIMTAIIGGGLVLYHNKSNMKEKAQTYLAKEGYYKIADKQEKYVKTYNTVQKDYYKPKKSSSGGGSSSHTSSSGNSHSGGGFSF